MKRRSSSFNTRWIEEMLTRASAISPGRQDRLYLDARRDWRHANGHVRGKWLICLAALADGFVSARLTTRLRTFVESAFKNIGIALRREGAGLEGFRRGTGRCVIAGDRRQAA